MKGLFNKNPVEESETDLPPHNGNELEQQHSSTPANDMMSKDSCASTIDLTCAVRRHVKVLSRRKCNFSDAVFNPPQFVDIFPDPQLTSLFTIARSKEIGVQCQACDVSALNINTDCATTEAHGVFHKEGGWPRDVNPQEAAAYSDPFWKNLFDHKENDSYIKC
ncbi:hypothetical protein DAPPUDRAFT_333795 [Daphnia pulex]|uniref:Uncharacterized protein n=1 Tax=Daphnia pulex TaxID=6669 RepID=E9HTV1_DAPPU|nr:hypothetical protein DAPPUDRAFT_333795 [Daphnia pulex]|eukprot:EFX64830.1 hypothetical protein DAPPUDRAFT_333795 [Daphnia pulex]